MHANSRLRIDGFKYEFMSTIWVYVQKIVVGNELHVNFRMTICVITFENISLVLLPDPKLALAKWWKM